MSDTYTYELEQAIEAILEECELTSEGYDIFDTNGDPVSVDTALAAALEHAQRLVYGQEGVEIDEY